MSTLYDIEIEALEPCAAVLMVRPSQPDCCPFYTSRRFALAMLVDAPGVRVLTPSPIRRAELLVRGWTYAVTRNKRIYNSETSVAHHDDGPHLNLTESAEKGPVLGDIADSGAILDAGFLRFFE